MANGNDYYNYVAAPDEPTRVTMAAARLIGPDVDVDLDNEYVRGVCEMLRDASPEWTSADSLDAVAEAVAEAKAIAFPPPLAVGDIVRIRAHAHSGPWRIIGIHESYHYLVNQRKYSLGPHTLTLATFGTSRDRYGQGPEETVLAIGFKASQLRREV